MMLTYWCVVLCLAEEELGRGGSGWLSPLCVLFACLLLTSDEERLVLTMDLDGDR